MKETEEIEEIKETKEIKEIKEKNEIKPNVNNSINQKNLSKLLSSNLNDLRLSCPQCDFIPALFNDTKSKNIYQISSACENKHLISCMPVKQYFEHSVNLKDSSKSLLNDFICLKHNVNYNSFCKTCQKNICKECSDIEHKRHFISQFYEILPSNEEIIQLKNSIDNEVNDISVFLTETFNKWINELQQKFNELIENLKCKNKLYNFVINFYETKEFNYQNIYNIKIISENQLKKNPLTQEIQTLKNLIYREEENEKIKKQKNNLNENETKENYFKLKSSQFIKILNTINSDYNVNYKFTSFESASQILTNFLNDKNDKNSETEASQLSDYVIINPYKKEESNIKSSKNKNIENEKNLNEKMEFANEVKLNRRKLNDKIVVGTKINCLSVLKDYNGKLTNKFAAALDNGNINIYYVDPKKNMIYLDFEIKEHTKSVSYLTCLHDGRILTCSQDGTMKLIEETYSYILSFWRRYYLIQTLTRPNSDKYDPFQPISVIEMSNNTLVSGDWKHIIIWKLKKQKNKNKKDFSFDINDYNRDKYSYIYVIFKEINITTSVTALIKIDEKNFVSAHYGSKTVTFYNIYDNSFKTINNIRCVDSATQCMALIEAKKQESNYLKEKIIVVGGYECIYLLSIKNQNLIDKIRIGGNNYIKCLVNSGIEHVSNGFICGGLFDQYNHDIVHYNTKTQLGFNEIVVNEMGRIKETDKGTLNSVIFLKKNINDNSCNQKNIVIITGGNEEVIKEYYEKEENDDEEEDDKQL